MLIKTNILKHYTGTILAHQNAIINDWVKSPNVIEILSENDIENDYFKEKYAFRILKYYVDVIEDNASIGKCPTIIELLEYFREKNITSSQLYIICIQFRKSLIKYFFRKEIINEEIYDALTYIFDANFQAVLKEYSDTIFYAKQIAQEFQNLVNNSLNEIYIFDTNTLKFTYVNRGAVLNTGYTEDELHSMAPFNIKPEFHSKEKFKELIQPLCEHEKEHLTIQTQHQRKDGSLYDVDIRLQLMQFKSEEKYVAIINDITERLKAEKEKQHYYKLATHDYLTKIYNRQKFDTLCQTEFERSIRYKHDISLILFDIDNFKTINDRFGHKTGDAVLTDLTQLISFELRESDIFARWGGEEFVILLPHSDIGAAVKKAEFFRYTIANANFKSVGLMTCSFGVAQFDPLYNSQKLFIDADTALYKAKSKGKNRVEAAS